MPPTTEFAIEEPNESVHLAGLFLTFHRGGVEMPTTYGPQSSNPLIGWINNDRQLWLTGESGTICAA
jgi:hypothetical protein